MIEEKEQSESNEILEMILRQTDYTKEEAIQYLEKYENDPLKVIKNYMGIPDKKTDKPVKSINQEIYKQIRSNMDEVMRDYNKRQNAK
jgi:hypothetical protein